MFHPRRWLWPALLLAGLAAVYLPGLDNALVFDDARLTDGTIFDGYGSLLTLKQRLLSYGSFVWVQALAGDHLWVQRVVNLLLHAGVAFSLYALLRRLAAQVAWPTDLVAAPGFEASREAALRVAVLLYALNPVAVYAVAYLVQRSILTATLFVVLTCLAFVEGLRTRHVAWFVAAGACYVMALLSKEHALMTPALLVALYVFLRRPAPRQLAMVLGACALLVGAAAALFYVLYREVIGVAFDEQSRVYMEQLRALDPDIDARAWPLSIFNQAALFFRYGLLWVVPNVQWMSIDLRPAFPVSFTTMPHLLGAAAYVALFAASVWLLLRGKGVGAFVGLCLLFPLLLHVTEFLTVWVQDPFVLYRSYLWAIGLPGLLMLLFVGAGARTIHLVGLVLAVVFGALAVERVLSLQTPMSAWSDAADKIDLQAPPNAVGRWRAFLNRGSQYLERDQAEPAYADFARAESLGEGLGSARFNMGVALQLLKRPQDAVQQFNLAAAKGFDDPMLYYHRGENLATLQRFDDALKDFDRAVQGTSDDAVGDHVRMRRAETAIPARAYDVAASDLETLLRKRPDDYRVRLALGMAYIGQQKGAQALPLFEALVTERPAAAAFYGRAMANGQLGRRSAALADIDRALALEPRNPAYRAMRQVLAQGVTQ